MELPTSREPTKLSKNAVSNNLYILLKNKEIKRKRGVYGCPEKSSNYFIYYVN